MLIGMSEENVSIFRVAVVPLALKMETPDPFDITE
jgi:hypothetical protein